MGLIYCLLMEFLSKRSWPKVRPNLYHSRTELGVEPLPFDPPTVFVRRHAAKVAAITP